MTLTGLITVLYSVFEVIIAMKKDPELNGSVDLN